MATIGQYKGTDIIGGTQDYVNQQIRNIDALATKPNIPPTTPPTSAKDISGNFPSFNMPNIPTTYTPIDSAIATTAGEKEYVSRVQKEQEAAFQRAQQQTQADRGILSEILSRKPDRKAIMAEAESELDTGRAEMLNQINSVIKEVDTLNQSYNKEKELMDSTIARMEENLGGQSQAGLDYNIAKTQRNFSIKLNALAAGINAKTATVEALRGNYKLANDYIQQAVDAETAQYKDDLDALLLYREFNNDAFERIDSVYRDAYEAEITIAQNRLADEREKAMAKYKADLDASTGKTIDALKAAEINAAYPGANILPGDTEDIANQKIINSGNLTIDEKISLEVSNYVKNGFTKQEAIDEADSTPGLTPVQLRKIKEEINKQFSNPNQVQQPGFFQRLFGGNTAVKSQQPDKLSQNFSELNNYGGINDVSTGIGDFFRGFINNQ
jgi:hypothetical protein